MNNDAVQDWLRVRRELLDREAGFTSLAMKVASGEASAEHLQQERVLLEASREACKAAYERAFPALKKADVG